MVWQSWSRRDEDEGGEGEDATSGRAHAAGDSWRTPRGRWVPFKAGAAVECVRCGMRDMLSVPEAVRDEVGPADIMAVLYKSQAQSEWAGDAGKGRGL